MAGFFTEYLNNKILDQVFGASAFEPPPALYVGLSQGSANRTGVLAEPPGGGYTRVAIENDAGTFPASAGGIKSNATPIVFPRPTSDWGLIRSLFVADAAHGGNVLAMTDLLNPRRVGSDSAPAKVAAGGLLLMHG